MNIDFPTLLVTATAITGVVWAADALWFAPRRRRRVDQLLAQGAAPDALQQAGREPALVETSRSFFPVILAVLLLRSFVVEPFRIPSGSMMPTLLVGDFILVNKFAYGIRLPVVDTKIIEVGSPQRGDVVVFRYPEDPSVDYIKRVVGLPGDHISYHNKQLQVNGVTVPRVPQGAYRGVGAGAVMTGASRVREKLGDTEFDTLVAPGHLSMDGEAVIPPGHYFVMGDNRDNSKDSRYWGTLPEENLVGKAFFIWMNWDSANGGIGWDRLGTVIH